MNTLISFFLNRPLLVNLIMVFVFVLGLATIADMRYEYNPLVDLGVVNITTFDAGSSPEETELALTLPIEEELLKVDNLKKIYSNSMEGLSVITVRIDVDSGDKRKTLAEIQKAVDRAVTRLPVDLIEKPQVEELSTLLTPVMEVHVVGDVSEGLLRSAARSVEDGLREVKGVASIRKVGYRRQEIKIQLQAGQAAALGISHGEIINSIRSHNVRDSGGSLESFVAEKKVLSVGQFTEPGEVSEVIVRSIEEGNVIRVRDIAEVIEGYEDWEIQSRTDGQLSIALLVRKKELADELHTARNISSFLEQSQVSMPQGVELKQVNDISRLTTNMLDVLVGNALVGLMAVFILLCLLLNVRFAIWVALGLPFAICLTFLLLASIDITINAISLIAIILLMGILVDDAVVVSESVQRLREAGVDRMKASLDGTLLVAQPVVFSALTTMLAFAPLLFMSGADAAFMSDFPVTVVVLLLASLFECLYLLPTHLSHVRITVSSQSQQNSQFFDRLRDRYYRFVAGAVERRYLSLLLFIVLMIGILAFGAATIRFVLYPKPDIDSINIKVELPTGTSFQETVDRVKRIESDVRTMVNGEDLLNVTSQIGHHDTDMYGATEGRNRSWAVVSLFLKPVGQRDTDTYELTDELRGWALGEEDASALTVVPLTDIPVTGKPVEVEVISNGEERFIIAEQLLDWLAEQPAVTSYWTSYHAGRDILDLQFNHPLMAARGLTVADVSRAVRIAIDGELIDELQTLDERVRYRLQLPPVHSGSLSTLENLAIVNSRGEAIYLKSIAEFKLRKGEADIKHYFGKRTVTVYAEIDREKISVEEINGSLAKFISDQSLTSQYSDARIWQGGELEQQAEVLGNLGQATMICVLSIFALLVVLFNSLSHPLLIMIVVPFGMTGVVIGFGVQGLEMGMMAMMGVIGLIGVLVNDSLVLVHTLNRTREENGGSLTVSKIAEVSRLRFRPIVITSITTVVGLLPTAYGILGENSYITPMVMAMAWGVMFGGISTLILLPCLYAIDQDLKAWFGRLLPA
ncbi:MAG: efflux RND transporter permease subunit [Gammaproteobacteria bacterium]|jgi:multidrug efflux pump subunit AcrB|nr:efflux RND transporter permease subunit [Gammaproteobacteria bacterium]MBT4492960.1 efflux RND transporter permease subunit [Gammaproteobacteria bacterium]MBT7370424.1 efflux RND transporter permease subunit [Gammaproteobacteria bacterium]